MRIFIIGKTGPNGVFVRKLVVKEYNLELENAKKVKVNIG